MGTLSRWSMTSITDFFTVLCTKLDRFCSVNLSRLLWYKYNVPLEWKFLWSVYIIIAISMRLMMTSSNGNIFRVTRPLWGASTPHKGQGRGGSMFSSICTWTNDWANNLNAGDLRHHLSHHDDGEKYVHPAWSVFVDACHDDQLSCKTNW